MTQSPLNRPATLMTLALSWVACAAQTTNSASLAVAPAASPSAFEQFVKETKNPLDWITWGADLRLRNEYINNFQSLSSSAALNEQDYFRFRGRLWTTITPVTNVTVNGRISAEPREWMKPSSAGTFRGRTGLEWRYGIVDTLNVKLTNVVHEPLTLTVGRQDIQLGEPQTPWLIMDGTPGDGSWTFFFDSARATYEAKDIKTRFDVIYLNNYADPGARIPTMGSTVSLTGAPYYVIENNEKGTIAYASNKSIQNTTVDGYFIWKEDEQVTAAGDSAELYTLGARISGQPAEHWYYSVEGAYQFGTRQDANVYRNTPAGVGVSSLEWRDISAFGGIAQARYSFLDRLKNQVTLVGEFLSGDDPNTAGRDEMFDILWGRWPRWTEGYIFSYIPETSGRIAQMNNLFRIGPTWMITPFKGASGMVSYNAMFAPEAMPTRATAGGEPYFSNDGHFRGHYLEAIWRQEITKNLAVRLWLNMVFEGNYYAQHDTCTFVRAEIYLTW
jgi:hypothetical protein